MPTSVPPKPFALFESRVTFPPQEPQKFTVAGSWAPQTMQYVTCNGNMVEPDARELAGPAMLVVKTLRVRKGEAIRTLCDEDLTAVSAFGTAVWLTTAL